MMFVGIMLRKNNLMLLTILFAIIISLLFMTFSDDSLKNHKRSIDEPYNNDKIIRRLLNPNNKVPKKPSIKKPKIRTDETKTTSTKEGKIKETSSTTEKNDEKTSSTADEETTKSSSDKEQ